MKTNRYLLPTCFKVIGWLISVPSALILLIYLFCKPWDAVPPTIFPSLFEKQLWGYVLDIFAGDPIYTSVCMVLLMVGLLFIAFSKEKIEDEYITKLRGDSLIWAVIVNSGLIMIASVLVYGGWFLYVSFFNLYTLPILFIIKFKFALNNFKKIDYDEE